MADYKYRGSQPWVPDPPRERKKRRPRKNLVLKPCGTPAAYSRHLANGEQPCDPCRAAHISRQAATTKAKAEAEGRVYKPMSQIPDCGTTAGYARHLKRKETTCPPCRAAKTARTAERKKERAKKAATP